MPGTPTECQSGCSPAATSGTPTRATNQAATIARCGCRLGACGAGAWPAASGPPPSAASVAFGRAGGDDVDVDGPSGRGPDDPVDHRAPRQLRPFGLLRRAHEELGRVLAHGEADEGVRHVGAGDLDEPPAQLLQQDAAVFEQLLIGAGQPVGAADVDADQLGVGAGRQAGAPADEALAAGRAGEGDHHPLPGLPRLGQAVALPVVLQALVDPVGDPQQGQLPEGAQVPQPEVVARAASTFSAA